MLFVPAAGPTARGFRSVFGLAGVGIVGVLLTGVCFVSPTMSKHYINVEVGLSYLIRDPTNKNFPIGIDTIQLPQTRNARVSFAAIVKMDETLMIICCVWSA